jgi:superfamily II DNA/RNA helicase
VSLRRALLGLDGGPDAHMGFINDVGAIVHKAPMSRQTLLFSATFPDGSAIVPALSRASKQCGSTW